MTNEEAIRLLTQDKNYCLAHPIECGENAYKKYDRAISALERQIPKKPREEWSESPFSDDGDCLFLHLMCSNCGRMEVDKLDYFCPLCGWAIDWSNE